MLVDGGMVRGFGRGFFFCFGVTICVGFLKSLLFFLICVLLLFLILIWLCDGLFMFFLFLVLLFDIRCFFFIGLLLFGFLFLNFVFLESVFIWFELWLFVAVLLFFDVIVWLYNDLLFFMDDVELYVLVVLLYRICRNEVKFVNNMK